MGPFDKAQINELRASGIIQPSYAVRTEGEQQSGTAQQASADQQYWVVLGSGRQLGPYTKAALASLASMGKIGAATMVLAQGMETPVAYSSLGAGANPASPAAEAQPSFPDGSAAPSSEAHAASYAPTLDKLDRFSFGRFISGIFQRHTSDELLMDFCAGTPFGTPDIRSVHATWPSPWIFARIAGLFILLYVGLIFTMVEYSNPKLIPAIMFVANFGVPFSVLVLLFEFNIRRDIPFYAVVKAFLLGGVLSLFITSILNEKIHLGPEAYWAGPIEEPAKLLAAIFIASSFRNGRILTGTLIGCAIGAGFAAFESAGYGFEIGFESFLQTFIAGLKEITPEHLSDLVRHGLDKYTTEMDHLSVRRAILAPGMHVVWAAITAGAYWQVLSQKIRQGVRAAEDRSVDFSVFVDTGFLKFAVISVGLHMLWNSQIGADYGWYKYLVLGLIAWAVLLWLVQSGINQVKEEKLKALQGQ